jgi:malate synthase
VDTCREVFTEHLGARDDQRDRPTGENTVTPADLTTVGDATVTLDGVRTNISAALRYLSRWVAGYGAVAIDSLMEDAATVEISRAQLWQWIRCSTRTADGPVVTRDLVTSMIEAQAAGLIAGGQWGTANEIAAAVDILTETALGAELPSFFTPYAYVRYLTERPLRVTGPLRPEDLRQSEQVPGATTRDQEAAA